MAALMAVVAAVPMEVRVLVPQVRFVLFGPDAPAHSRQLV